MLAFKLGKVVDQLLGQACVSRQPVAVVSMPRKEMQPEIEWRKRVSLLLPRIRFLHQVIELAAGAFGRGLDVNELTGVDGAERPSLDLFRLVGRKRADLAVFRHVQNLQRATAMRRADLDAGAIFESDLSR